MGIFASGQAYEQMILRLMASPLPEARDYGRMILNELKAMMPSFVARVERPDRGGEWVGYLEQRGQAADRWAARLGLDHTRGGEQEAGPSVRLLDVQGSEDELLSALLFESAAAPESEARAAVRALPPGRARADARRADRASGATAATGPAGGSRRCATGSRWCPTTAPSATCSATGCSPSSGSR